MLPTIIDFSCLIILLLEEPDLRADRMSKLHRGNSFIFPPLSPVKPNGSCLDDLGLSMPNKGQAPALIFSQCSKDGVVVSASPGLVCTKDEETSGGKNICSFAEHSWVLWANNAEFSRFCTVMVFFVKMQSKKTPNSVLLCRESK